MKKTLPFYLVVFLEVVSLFFFIATALILVYQGIQSNRIPEGLNTFKADDKSYMLIYYVMAVLGLLQFLLFRVPLRKMHVQAIHDRDYDEFGNSKRKSFDNLSRAERDEIDRQKTLLREQLLPTSVIKKMTKEGSKDPDKDLENMIGLNEARKVLRTLSSRMEFERLSQKKGDKDKKSDFMSGKSYVFYGSPGTGKTTFARIFCGYLYKYGYLKKNKVIEISGGFLKAGEHSEEKTKYVIQEAMDGVLFIDEAYSIIEGNENYGKAVIAELIKQMEDNRDRLVIILAGYKPSMERLLNANEGFKSRVREYIEFPDYSIMDLKEIFITMAREKNFVVSEGAMDNFEERIAREKSLITFANARTVRNILDECIDNHALNFMNKLISNEEKFVLTKDDVRIFIDKNRL